MPTGAFAWLTSLGTEVVSDLLFSSSSAVAGLSNHEDSRLILTALVKWDLLVNQQQGLNRTHTHLLPPNSTKSLLRASQSHMEVLGGAVAWWEGGDDLRKVTSLLVFWRNGGSSRPTALRLCLMVFRICRNYFYVSLGALNLRKATMSHAVTLKEWMPLPERGPWSFVVHISLMQSLRWKQLNSHQRKTPGMAITWKDILEGKVLACCFILLPIGLYSKFLFLLVPLFDIL